MKLTLFLLLFSWLEVKCKKKQLTKQFEPGFDYVHILRLVNT